MGVGRFSHLGLFLSILTIIGGCKSEKPHYFEDKNIGLICQEGITAPDSCRAQISGWLEWSGSEDQSLPVESLNSFESTFEVPALYFEVFGEKYPELQRDLTANGFSVVPKKLHASGIEITVLDLNDGQAKDAMMGTTTPVVKITCNIDELKKTSFTDGGGIPDRMKPLTQYQTNFFGQCNGYQNLAVLVQVTHQGKNTKTVRYEVSLGIVNDKGFEHLVKSKIQYVSTNSAKRKTEKI